jgi:hypothetical protein
MKQLAISHARFLVLILGGVTGIVDGGSLTLEVGAVSLESPVAVAAETPRGAESAEIQGRAVPFPEPPDSLAERAQTEQAVRTIQQGRQTTAQLRQMLIAHPDPGIRAKVTQASAGNPIKGQSGGGEPAENQVERQDAQTVLSSIQQGRLTSEQLRQLLLTHPDPKIRSKALKAQGGKPQRSGELLLGESTPLLSFFWNLVNPFAAVDANAQAPVSIRLTPQNPYSPPPAGTTYNGAYMNMYSAAVTTTYSGTTTYQLNPPPLLVRTPPSPTPSNPTSVAPSHQIKVTLNYPGPPGYYIIDVYGVGGANAKLYRYNYYGHSYLFAQSWAGGPGTQHYITVENFNQGLLETFYFSVGQSPFALAEVWIQQF